MSNLDVKRLKKLGRWPLPVVPKAYMEGFNYWYSDTNLKRIDDSLKETFKLSGGEAILDISFGNPIILNRALLYSNSYKGHYLFKNTAISKKFPDTIITVGDYYDLPYSNDSFHVIASYAFLHIIPDIPTFYKEVYRLLKPGGVLYTDGDRNIKLLKIIRLIRLAAYKLTFSSKDEVYFYWKNLLQPQDNFHSEGIDYSDLRKLLLEIGFRKVYVQPWFTTNPKFDKNILIKLIEQLLHIFRLNLLFTHIKIIAVK